MIMASSIELIRIKFRKIGDRKSVIRPFSTFAEFIERANRLAKDAIEKTEKDRGKFSVSSVAAHNFVVNCVTGLEVYLRQIILGNKHWDDKGLNSLLKEKLTLGEAYNLFNNEKLTREYIIAHYYSFQNLEAIYEIFSKLTGTDFFVAVEKFKPTHNGLGTLVEEIPDWRKQFALMFSVRNNFVHEGTLTTLEDSDIDNLYILVVMFVIILDDWLEIKYPD